MKTCKAFISFPVEMCMESTKNWTIYKFLKLYRFFKNFRPSRGSRYVEMQIRIRAFKKIRVLGENT
jgi:hypothetical protein